MFVRRVYEACLTPTSTGITDPTRRKKEEDTAWVCPVPLNNPGTGGTEGAPAAGRFKVTAPKTMVEKPTHAGSAGDTTGIPVGGEKVHAESVGADVTAEGTGNTPVRGGAPKVGAVPHPCQVIRQLTRPD